MTDDEQHDDKRTIGDEADIDKIKDEFKSKPDPVQMNINRVPRDVSSDFKDWCDENFAGDYGMGLTFLWERESIRTELNRQLKQQEQRIQQLEQLVNTLINEQEEDDNDDGLNRLNS